MPPMRAWRNKPDCFGGALPRNNGGGGDQIGEEIGSLPSSPVLDTTRYDGKLSERGEGKCITAGVLGRGVF